MYISSQVSLMNQLPEQNGFRHISARFVYLRRRVDYSKQHNLVNIDSVFHCGILTAKRQHTFIILILTLETGILLRSKRIKMVWSERMVLESSSNMIPSKLLLTIKLSKIYLICFFIVRDIWHFFGKVASFKRICFRSFRCICFIFLFCWSKWHFHHSKILVLFSLW